MCEMTGTLCSGNLQPMKATYALASQKVKRTEPFDRDEALMRFTRKYFQSRQPAALEDFVWWSGLNISDCRRGIELLGDYLHVETQNFASLPRRDFYLTDDCRTRGFRKGQYLLIPPYDEYLIGYKSRDIVLPPEYQHRAHNNRGIFQPIIAHDGIICGNWSPFRENCQADFFGGSHNMEGLQDAWNLFQRFRHKEKQESNSSWKINSVK